MGSKSPNTYLQSRPLLGGGSFPLPEPAVRMRPNPNLCLPKVQTPECHDRMSVDRTRRSIMFLVPRQTREMMAHLTCHFVQKVNQCNITRCNQGASMEKSKKKTIIGGCYTASSEMKLIALSTTHAGTLPVIRQGNLSWYLTRSHSRFRCLASLGSSGISDIQ